MRSSTGQSFDWTTHIDNLPEKPKFTELWERELRRLLRRHLAPSRLGTLSVLEVGCSNGRWLRWLKSEFGAATYGVDTNAIGAANVESFILGDARSIPVASNSFDVVFSIGLVEHFRSEERLQIIREHARVAKRGTGLVFLQHPNMDISLNRYYVRYFYDLRQGYRHYLLTACETVKNCRLSDLRVLERKWLGWIVIKAFEIISQKLRLPGKLARVLRPAFSTKWSGLPFLCEEFFVLAQKEA